LSVLLLAVKTRELLQAYAVTLLRDAITQDARAYRCALLLRTWRMLPDRRLLLPTPLRLLLLTWSASIPPAWAQLQVLGQEQLLMLGG
jgi:hypothetical protein